MYRVQLIAESGKRTLLSIFDDLIETRDFVASFLQERREEGEPVCRTTSKRGCEQRKDFGQFYIGREEDILQYDHIVFSCPNCREEHETKQDALSCCNYSYHAREEEMELVF